MEVTVTDPETGETHSGYWSFEVVDDGEVVADCHVGPDLLDALDLDVGGVLTAWEDAQDDDWCPFVTERRNTFDLSDSKLHSGIGRSD